MAISFAFRTRAYIRACIRMYVCMYVWTFRQRWSSQRKGNRLRFPFPFSFSFFLFFFFFQIASFFKQILGWPKSGLRFLPINVCISSKIYLHLLKYTCILRYISFLLINVCISSNIYICLLKYTNIF